MKVQIKNIILALTIVFSLIFNGCGGCSKSGTNTTSNRYMRTPYETQDHTKTNAQEQMIVEIENKNGVKYIWIEINGLRLKFIFDTGASSISISSAEATVLYRQGTLHKDDIIDIQYFTDATGSVSAGTKINLRTVKIGDRILQNIEATVIDNVDAPLLLGQSALERFGKITIDNRKNIIILE